ncbi:MAG: hypothetical protein H6625_02155 [Bdellovibrionaceae bacterium]|nr:hypothetical protein [Pseudobdellovibrionaceae bacterium]
MIQKISKYFVYITVIFSVSSCKNKFEPKEYAPIQLEYASQSDKNIKAPKVLIEEIEKYFIKNYKKTFPDKKTSEVNILSSIPRKFLGFDVYLRPGSNKLAMSDVKQIPFSRGGGYIDLANLVEGNVGSFYINILFDWQDIMMEPSDVDQLKVYFLSRSIRRTIDGEEWGAGCGKLLDLTHFFKNQIMKKGLLLNAKDQRYLSTLGGTFYFILFKQGELFLATATFEDTRFKDLMCKA